MYTIKKECSFEQVINKSIFICYLFPVNSIEEVNNYLIQTRKKHYDANHNCYAYIIGDNGEYYKQSDDKEPSQTAGIVILNALKKNNLTNILAIVTRYFGGIKLGAGGLIRAYSSSTSKAIELSEIYEIIQMVSITIECDYLWVSIIEKEMQGFEEVNKSFSSFVSLTYLIPMEEKDNIMKNLVSLTKNKINIKLS